MAKKSGSHSGEPLLFIPYTQKPYLENRKKVRGKNRKIFDQLQEIALQLQIALDRNELESEQVKEDTRQFLVILQGAKKK